MQQKMLEKTIKTYIHTHVLVFGISGSLNEEHSVARKWKNKIQELAGHFECYRVYSMVPWFTRVTFLRRLRRGEQIRFRPTPLNTHTVLVGDSIVLTKPCKKLSCAPWGLMVMASGGGAIVVVMDYSQPSVGVALLPRFAAGRR